MNKKEDVLDVIYKSVDKINETQPQDARLEKAENSKIFGPESSLDSLAFISFIIDVEKNVSDKYGKVISLANDNAMSKTKSPFDTLGSMADYISTLL